MSKPNPPDQGNVVDSEVLAHRRARRAEVTEDTPLELRLLEAERRLGEVATERDVLKARLDELERDMRSTRQREWAEQQQRLEAQGEAAATRELATGQVIALRERLAAAEAELALVSAERDRTRVALERERQRVSEEAASLRDEVQRRRRLAAEAAAVAAQTRRELVADHEARAAETAALEARLTAEREGFSERVRAVEAAVALVRDRLGAAVRGLQERLTTERAARQSAEAALVVSREDARRARLQASALEAELARRSDVEAQMRRTLDAVHGELQAVRAGDAARVAQLSARMEAVVGLATTLRDDVTRERTAEQDALAASLAAMRERVAELQDGLAAAAALGRELDAERTARWGVEAELQAERERAAGDRAELDEVEAELQAERERAAAERVARDEVEAELQAERERAAAERAVRDEVEAELEAERDRATADRAVRDAVEVELAAERERVAAERAVRDQVEAELAAERDRAAADRAVRDAAEAELESERVRAADDRAVRDAAQAELEAERARLASERAAREAAEARVAEAAAELEDLRAVARPAAPDPAQLAALREAFELLRATDPTPSEASLSFDLAAAAARLRAGEPAEDASTDPAEPEPESEVAEEAPAPTPEHSPIRSPLPNRQPVGTPGPWLRDALAALAETEADITELLLVSLLPAQAGLGRWPLTYELSVTGGATHRVTIGAEGAGVGVAADDAEPQARISGPLSALVPLGAGGAGRRLPGARIHGRRFVRGLLKARREPLGLAELDDAGVALSPGLLLTVLARAVQPEWTSGEALVVDIAPAGSDTWRIVANGRSPLAILPADDEPAAATLHTSTGRLAAVLAATAGPGEAWVDGDIEAVRTLLSWLDRAQRSPG